MPARSSPVRRLGTAAGMQAVGEAGPTSWAILFSTILSVLTIPLLISWLGTI
jgi:hypothetical protein